MPDHFELMYFENHHNGAIVSSNHWIVCIGHHILAGSHDQSSVIEISSRILSFWYYSCNTGMRALSDTYSRLPEGCRPKGRDIKQSLNALCYSYYVIFTRLIACTG